LTEQNVLFLKRLDYPKFLASLPDTESTACDLAASGVVLQVAKEHVGYIDAFNFDPKAEPSGRKINIGIFR